MDIEIPAEFAESARRVRQGRLHAYETLEGSTTALIIIDMQEYFLTEGMPAYVPGGVALLPGINRVANAVRDAGGMVAWVQTVASDSEDFWPSRRDATAAEYWRQRRELLGPEGRGYPLHAACDVSVNDAQVQKTRFSAFIPHPSPLHQVLVDAGIRDVLIAGVATSTCCESTGRDASMWGWRTTLLSDATADARESWHRHALGKFISTFGDVRNQEQVLSMLAASRSDQP